MREDHTTLVTVHWVSGVNTCCQEVSEDEGHTTHCAGAGEWVSGRREGRLVSAVRKMQASSPVLDATLIKEPQGNSERLLGVVPHVVPTHVHWAMQAWHNSLAKT